MKFAYRARTEGGEIQAGFVEASSKDAALDILREYGLFPTSLEEGKKSFREAFPSFFGRVSLRDIVLFTRQLAILVKSEISVVESLETIARQTKKVDLKEKILDIAQQVEDGTTLSKALNTFPDMFSGFYIGMMKSGEKSGNIPECLDYLASYLERERDLRDQFLGAILYPAFVLAIFTFLLLAMSIFVVPSFQEIFQEMNIELPILTQIVVSAAMLLRDWWWALLILFFGAGSAIFYFFQNKQIRTKLDEVYLRIPMLGGLLKKIYLSRIALNISTLVSGGVSISETLEVTAELVGNNIYKKILLETREGVRAGKEISSILTVYPKFFSIFFIQMIVTGEKSGNLDSALQNVVVFYKKEVDRTLTQLMKFIEPILIIFLGVLIGGLALSLFIPLFQQGGLAM